MKQATLSALAALALFPAAAFATGIEVTVLSSQSTGSFSVTNSGYSSVISNGGKFKIKIHQEGWEDPLWAYCSDPYETLGLGKVVFDDLVSLENSMANSGLYSVARSIVGGFAAATDAQNQKAAWEIKYELDDVFNVGTGTTTVFGTGSDTLPWNPNNLVDVFELRSSGMQNLLVWKPSEATVPITPTAALLGIGLLGFMRLRRNGDETAV